MEQLAERAWSEFDRVDMVFNNAGIGIGQKPIIDTPMEELHAVFDVNFFGVWHVCRDQFYIVSHAYNMQHIEGRYAEIARAYETYAPRYDGDEEYDVRYLLAQMDN